MTRRDLLTALAALPLCGWMKPKTHTLTFGPFKGRWMRIVSVGFVDENGVARLHKVEPPLLRERKEHSLFSGCRSASDARRIGSDGPEEL